MVDGFVCAWVWCVVWEGLLCWLQAGAGLGRVHVKCVGCGGRGERGGSVLESWWRGGRARADVPKSARVCEERESGEGRAEERAGVGIFTLT